MKKICFVVQRYGLEVNGGAEVHCRLFAEHMTKYYDVSVVTTKAKDHISWKNEYSSSFETINGVKVFRFDVIKTRNIEYFVEYHHRFLNGEKIKETEWLDRQGPVVPELVTWLRQHKDEYSVFIFYTYLYYPTVYGVREVADKAIIVPTAHDEPQIYMNIFKEVFEVPRAVFYLTEEEKEFVGKLFNVKQKMSETGGVGVELPSDIDPGRFRHKYGIDNYILYVGRIELEKGCDRLFKYFLKYKQDNPGSLKLLLMGKSNIEIPKNPDIINLGFVSEQQKYDGLAGAKLLVMPSPHESLSMVVLEAMSSSIPVLVNADCSVLVGHCRKSNGGLWYYNYPEFEACLSFLLSNENTRINIGLHGKKYVDLNYTWDTMEKKFLSLVRMVEEDTLEK